MTVSTEKPKKMDIYPLSFNLWKKDENRENHWVCYAGEKHFFSMETTSNSYQRALRLIARGWMAYAPFQRPPFHEPLKMEIETAFIDYDRHLRNLDPTGYRIGDYMREFLSNHHNAHKKVKKEKPDRNYILGDAVVLESDEKKKIVFDMALKRSIQDYTNGKRIPTLFVKDVLEYLSNQRRVETK